MRLPRRVPWASKGELAELYDMIFSPAASDLSRQAAFSRMSVYISSPSCPAFIHLLHSLIGALALPYPPTTAQEGGVARMTYAMALVRFVNGMVDPLQTGSHARPISHLAASLNLPQSLIALRHRATHEDLPPLPLLRRGVETAVDYLHRNSFLPLLASTSEIGWERRTRAEGIVTRWKKVVKARVKARDVTKESESGKAVKALLREIEGEDIDDVLEAIVRIGLVPVARKKRPSKRSTTPTAESIQLWTPLLAHLQGIHPTIAALLAQHIVNVLEETAPRYHPDADDERRKELASYRWTLGTWLFHLWEDETLEEERSSILRQLAKELVHPDDVLRRVYALLDAESMAEFSSLLPSDEEEVEDELEGLELDEPAGGDVDASLAAMESNLRALEDKLSRQPPVQQDGERVSGWTRAEEWKPCPIGVWA